MDKRVKNIEFSRLSAREMQRYGETNFAEPFYRADVARRLAKSTDTSRLITFDDVINAVPEGLRPALHGLPGYERHLLHTLLLAPGFDNGAVAISSAPPNMTEMGNIHRTKQALEKKLGRSIDFEIFFFFKGKGVDLMKVRAEDYRKLAEFYATEMNNTANAAIYGKETYLAELASSQAEGLTRRHRSLCLPFEMTPLHWSYLSKRMVLPDIPEMDKAYNKLKLQEKGFRNVNPTIAVTPAGRLLTKFEDFKNYKKYVKEHKFPSNPQNILNYAKGIIAAIDEFTKRGIKSFTKLDTIGVSGISNIHPDVHPVIYNPSIPPQERVKYLFNLIASSSANYLPDAALVEEFVQPKKLEGVQQDTTYGGLAIAGEFYPMSAFPFGTDQNGVYTHGWISNDPRDIHEDPHEWQRGFQIFEEMTQKLDLSNGVVAGDVFATQNGKQLVHDWNLRRGGRSHVEAFIATNDGGWFEVQVEVPLSQKMHNLDIYRIHSQVCADLSQRHVAPYSTSFGYFGKGHDQDFMKFKLLVPYTAFGSGNRLPPRSQHHGMISQYVNQVVNSYLTR